MLRSGLLRDKFFVFALQLFCAGVGTSLCSQTSAADPVALTVDASTTVNIGAGTNDLTTLQSLYQGAHAPQDWLSIAPLDPMFADLNMKRMRILEADVYCDLDNDGNFILTHSASEWDGLTYQIDWAAQHGLTIHFPVAFFVPQSFAAYGPAETWNSTVLNRYKSYAEQLVRYVVKRVFDYGLPTVIFEVGNEYDLEDVGPANFDAWYNSGGTIPVQYLPLGPWGRGLWWMDPATYDMTANNWYVPGVGYPFIGDPRRLPRQIVPVQKIYADAVASVKADTQFMANYPGKTIEIAGPATATNSFKDAEDPVTHAQQETLDEKFLDYMYDSQTASGQYNVSKLDYYSFHFYGDFQHGPVPTNPVPKTNSLKYMTDRVRAKLAALGHPETKLFLSEWGPTTDFTSDINYSHKGAAWAAAFLTEAVADKVALGSFLLMDDAMTTQATGYAPQVSFVGKINGAVYPKPATNVFKMFTMMKGTRNAVTGLSNSNPNLGAFAASDANSAGIIVFNYNSQFVDDTTTTQTFTVELDNLPFSGVVTVERYLVDANTSNFATFLAAVNANQTPLPDPSLQMVEQFPTQILANPASNTGTLVLPQRSLNLGVTFWRIKKT